jgi:hypothetical protein
MCVYLAYVRTFSCLTYLCVCASAGHDLSYNVVALWSYKFVQS